MSRLVARLAAKAHGAVTVTAAVADAVVVAVFRARRAHAQATHLVQLHAFLIDAHACLAALGSVGSQSRIYGLQPEIDQSRAAGNDLAAVRDIGIAQLRNRLHAELEAFVQMDAVQHAALHVRLAALHELLVLSIVATVAQPRALQILLVALHGVVARGSPEYTALVGMGAA